MTTPKKKSKKKKITSVGGSSKKTKSVTDVVSSKAPVSEPSKPSLHRRGSSLEGTDGTGTSRSDSIRDENLGEKQKSLDGKSSGTNLLNENDRSGSSKTKLVTNVQVCARIRPLHCHSESTEGEKTVKSSSRQVNSKKKKSKVSSSSSQEDDTFVAWDISEDNSSASQSSKTEKVHGRTHSYTLDRVFGTDATTDQIYHESVASLVKAAMEGYNSTVLAYGQTSTGKTHTMTGQRDDTGIVPLCVNDCFKYVRENASDEPREYLFRFSYLEIYKEHIRDLLSSTTSAPEPVRLFDKSDGLIIRGLKEVVVSSPNKVFQLLKQGDKRRQVGATHMNRHSSRSHVVARLKIESSSAKGKGDETRVSVLSLVDLAGSESVRLNGAQRREEGQYINKSLMALGQVVLGLSESSKSKGEKKKKKKHIPYRDSKLTRLLQSSLSGNAQLLMMVRFCRNFNTNLFPALTYNFPPHSWSSVASVHWHLIWKNLTTPSNLQHAPSALSKRLLFTRPKTKRKHCFKLIVMKLKI
jgi:centromeric protein E